MKGQQHQVPAAALSATAARVLQPAISFTQQLVLQLQGLVGGQEHQDDGVGIQLLVVEVQHQISYQQLQGQTHLQVKPDTVAALRENTTTANTTQRAGAGARAAASVLAASQAAGTRQLPVLGE